MRPHGHDVSKQKRAPSGQSSGGRFVKMATSGAGRAAPSNLQTVSRGVTKPAARTPAPEPIRFDQYAQVKSVKKLAASQRMFAAADNRKDMNASRRESAQTFASKTDQGNLGAAVARKIFESEGWTVQPLRLSPDQKAADLHVLDHGVVEVKTGLSSNGETAFQWMAQPGSSDAERDRMAKMTDEEKRTYKKNQKIRTVKRKYKLLADLNKKMKNKLGAYTYGLILHPDSRTVDVFSMDEYHPSAIKWYSPLAQKGYKGTYRYEL